jgi:hypothetical protein
VQIAAAARDREGVGSGCGSGTGCWRAILTAYLTAEDNQPIHVLAGYTVAAVVGLRIIWGLWGRSCERFAGFVRGRARCWVSRRACDGEIEAIRRAQSGRRGDDHCSAALHRHGDLRHGASGRQEAGAAAGFIAAEGEPAGPVAGSAVEHDLAGAETSERAAKRFEEVHEMFVNFTLLLIACISWA